MEEVFPFGKGGQRDAKVNPLTDEEVAEKFKACARKALPSRKIAQAIKQIGQMEKVSRIRKFIDSIMMAS